MQTLIEKLNNISPAPLDCIIHVGAGRDAERADYNALLPNHLLIIEADPEASECLRDRFKCDDSVTVISELVGTSESEIDFHRYTLPTFNGPLGLGRLREIYPRIKEGESIQLRPRSLSDILQEQESHLGSCNLLILDTPGQELSILSALPGEWLPKFAFIILTGCSESWMEGADPLESSLFTLRDVCFERVAEEMEDPAWPRLLLHHDEAKADMKAELEKRGRLLAAKVGEIHGQAQRIQELEGQICGVSTQRDGLAAERDGMAARIVELEAQCAALDSGLAAKVGEIHGQAQRIQELEGQICGVSTQRDGLAAERNGMAARIVQLEAQCAALDSGLAAKVGEIHGQAQRIQELEGQICGVSTQRDGLVAERDGMAARIVELEGALQQAQGENTSLHDFLQESSKRLEIIDQELIKKDKKTELMDQEVHQMEGQLNLIRDLLFISEHKET
jgi:uncharacterized coiled-coil DUF342 family protein